MKKYTAYISKKLIATHDIPTQSFHQCKRHIQVVYNTVRVAEALLNLVGGSKVTGK